MKALVPLLLATLLLSACAPQTEDAASRPSPAATLAETRDPFTIVVMPDTQCYCDIQFAQSAKRWGNGDLRQYFYDQVDWIVASAEDLNTAFVVHAGDIVQSDYPAEWEIAEDALSRLDGKVPYCLSLGNHDVGITLNPDGKGYKSGMHRDTNFDTYFPRSRFEKEAWFGGTFDDTLSNAYFKFNESGVELLVISLEFQPRNEVLAWANRVCQENAERQVIILTHSYLNNENERITKKYPVEGNSGEEMWQKLVSQQPNIFMVLCGHSAGDGYLVSDGVHGNAVHQVLCDYQARHNGGESWLRYMTFSPLEDRIDVFTYNPSLDTFEETPNSRFHIEYNRAR